MAKSMINEPDATRSLEDELKRNRKLLEAIIETEPECVKLLNADGTLTLMNRAGLEMIQAASLDDVQGKCVYPLILPEHREAFKQLTEDVFRGRAGNLVFEMTGVEGRRLWLETHAVPLRNERDEIIALLGITRDVTERKRTEDALLQEKRFSDSVIDSLPGTFTICDEDGSLVRWNNNEKEVTGYSAEELTGMNVLKLFREDRDLVASKIKEAFDTGKASHEARIVTKSGVSIPFLLTGFRMEMNGKRYLVVVGIDISERKRLEEQLRQSQKMESIGELTGGIAHDFNNILTAIIGYGNLLQIKMNANDPLRHNVEQILASANRAAGLTQNLLAYSRKQVENPQTVDLNAIVERIEKLLTQLLGEDIELTTVLTDERALARADAGQIEQVLMHLATYCRDAMPGGGRLFIETEHVTVTEDTAPKHDYQKPGSYILVSVTDSGQGLDAAARERIFEPFYTSGEAGRGAGLGLAMAYSIVKQHEGTIHVAGEPGSGTTFRIYLPAVETVSADEKRAELPPIEGGTETILIAEDDAAVRGLTSSTLRQFGYTVIEAVDGEDAVNKFMENRDAVRLLILDVIMPKKSGRDAYDKIRIFHPAVRALFFSGYAAEVLKQKGMLDPDLHFIIKPVPMNELLRKVRTLLDTPV